MREIIKEVISSGVYNLSDLLRKINTLWLQASLTDQERDELIQLAQENANPEYGNKPIQDQLNTILERVASLETAFPHFVQRLNPLVEKFRSQGKLRNGQSGILGTGLGKAHGNNLANALITGNGGSPRLTTTYGNPVDLVCMRPSGKKKRDKVHLSQYALKGPCIHQNG